MWPMLSFDLLENNVEDLKVAVVVVVAAAIVVFVAAAAVALLAADAVAVAVVLELRLLSMLIAFAAQKTGRRNTEKISLSLIYT